MSVYWGRKKENLLMVYFSADDLNPKGSYPELMVGQKSILLNILKLLVFMLKPSRNEAA